MARAEKPDKLLFLLSGFLSNGCKDYLELLVEKEAPPFRIEWWEAPRLEQLARASANIMRKYGLSGNYPFVVFLHPAHLEWLRDRPRNSLKFLFKILDGLDIAERNDAMWVTYLQFINPKGRKPVNPNETIRDLLGGSVWYEGFRRRCYELSKGLPENIIVHAIIDCTLNYLFRLADSTRITELVRRNKESAEHFAEELAKYPPEPKASDLRACMKTCEEAARNMYERTKKAYKLYSYFCERVILKLLLEEIVVELPAEVAEMIEKMYGESGGAPGK